MKTQKKFLVAAALILSISSAVCAGYFNRGRRFSDLIPFPAENIERCEFSTGATDAAEDFSIDLSTEQLSDLLDCLESGRYQYAGKAEALQNCYVRLYLWFSNTNHIELMFSEEYILVNTDFGSKRRSPVYAITENGNALSECLKSFKG